jgi:hypothetical protein
LKVVFGFSYVSFYHLEPVVITRSRYRTPEFDMREFCLETRHF